MTKPTPLRNTTQINTGNPGKKRLPIDIPKPIVVPTWEEKTECFLTAALIGIKRGLPVPEFQDAKTEEALKKAIKVLENKGSLEEAKKILESAGVKTKKSIDPTWEKWIERTASTVPIAGYIVYVLITGDFSLSVLIGILTGS